MPFQFLVSPELNKKAMSPHGYFVPVGYPNIDTNKLIKIKTISPSRKLKSRFLKPIDLNTAKYNLSGCNQKGNKYASQIYPVRSIPPLTGCVPEFNFRSSTHTTIDNHSDKRHVQIIMGIY